MCIFFFLLIKFCQARLKFQQYSLILIQGNQYINKKNKNHMSQQISSLMSHIKATLKVEDIALKALHKPLQIALNEQVVYQKSPHTEPDNCAPRLEVKNKDSKITASSSDIANGLKIAFKNSIEDSKYQLKDIESNQATIANPNTIDQMKQGSRDNLLYFLKPGLDSQGIPIVNIDSLSICICMYSESKSMLKDTLKGVQENIINMVKAGTSCDDITVIVIIDGIQAMNNDMVGFFQEAERGTNIFIEEQKANNIELVSKKISGKFVDLSSDIQSDTYLETVNHSYVLFDQDEFDERNRRKFKNVHKKYLDIVGLKNNILIMQKNTPMFESLPGVVRKIFIQQARKDYEQFLTKKGVLHPIKTSNLKNILKQAQQQQNKIIDFTINNNTYFTILMKAFDQTLKHCDQYINNRNSLAYLASFRKKLKFNLANNDQEEQLMSETRRNLQETYMNLFLCVKYKNSGKLSSHNWFFNGFCKEIGPKYTILLDVGLRPQQYALYRMYRYLKQDEDVGGVCGYMGLKFQRLEQDEEIESNQIDFLSNFMQNFVEIQRAQQLQYHFAHLIDKPFESMFDFIHVLPGAFSAYNMTTLTQIDNNGNNLLKEYFKSIDKKLQRNKIKHVQITSIDVVKRILLPQSIYRCFWKPDPDSEQMMLENQNINLAEDRILCMGINKVGKKMHFLPDAYAIVDSIKSVHGLMGQRRRWINGSMYAFNKVKNEISNDNQQKSCKFFLQLQMLYLSFLNILSYFSPAILLFTVHLAMEAFRIDVLPLIFQGISMSPENSEFFDGFVYTIDFIYVLILGSIVFFSLNIKQDNKRFWPYIYFSSTILGLLQVGVLILLAVDLLRSIYGSQSFLQANATSTSQIVGGKSLLTAFRILLISSILIFIIPITIFTTIFKRFNILAQILMGLLSSIFYSPTYLVILNIFAFCRIDDISWGTKGLNTQQGSKSSSLKETWKILKYIQVYKFIFWNMVFGSIIVSFGSNYVSRFYISLIVLIILLLTMLIKIIIGQIYLIKYGCWKKIDPIYSEKKPEQKIAEQLRLLKNSVLKEIQQNLEQIVKKNKTKHPTNLDHFQKSRISILGKVRKNMKKIQQLNKQKQKMISERLPFFGNDQSSMQNFNIPQELFSFNEQTIGNQQSIIPCPSKAQLITNKQWKLVQSPIKQQKKYQKKSAKKN